MKDASHCSPSKRLSQIGGIKGSSFDTEKSEKLPNNYCYFEIDTKILNIKLVYKLLRKLFIESDIDIEYKTIITITGKYGERGYSFTSDDYGKYSLHLTDQYFVSHASLNCTDISQRLRLQGKYNDKELKNGTMKLTLWTTLELKNIIENFYIKFIKLIEENIMECKKWEHIKSLIENIIDTGDFKFKEHMKTIDVAKKRKNLKICKRFDKKYNGYQLIQLNNMTDEDIITYCKKRKLPDYVCINEIKELSKDEYIDKYGLDWKINTYFNLTIDELNEHLNNINNKNYVPTLDENGKQVCCLANANLKVWNYDDLYNKIKNYGINSTHGINNGLKSNNKYATRTWMGYNDNEEVRYILKLATKINNKILPDTTNNYIKKTPYIINNNIVKFSEKKEQFKDNLPDKYYWKTINGWLYLYDNDKPKIFSLEIISPENKNNNINEDIKLFTEECFKHTDKSNIRFGLKDIYILYIEWCKINKKKISTKQKEFKIELDKLDYKEETSKGVDINNNPGKRGYNIIVSIDTIE
jgi:hypothetical protein